MVQLFSGTVHSKMRLIDLHRFVWIGTALCGAFASANWLCAQSSLTDDKVSGGIVIAETAKDETAQLNHFEKYVRPALVKYCLECHSTETESNGGLVLDSRLGWEAGGDSGAAIIPGRPGESRLLQAILYSDPKLQMPPDKKLPPEVVKSFEIWIERGAYDPRAGAESKQIGRNGSQLVQAQSYWSYQPVQVPAIPESIDQPIAGTIDGFIAQKLNEVKIVAAPSASRREQVRRLYFDLTGLPPSPSLVREMEQSADFEADYSKLVDQLLSSPRYGEAFARKWMDVVRYAESVTLRGMIFKQAWRYRDYIVRAFADDRPFDQMIREQVAGDLLRADNSSERWNQLIATAFLAMGDTNFEKQDKDQLDMDYVDEQLDVIGQAFLGQTIGCARCHDHKFDPIPTRDYYALAGILKSAVAMRHANVSNWIDQALPLPPEQEQQFVKLESDLKQATKDMAEKKKLASTLAKKEKQTKPVEADNSKVDASALSDEIKLLESKMKQLQEEVDVRPRYLTVVEESPPKDLSIHIRGDVHNLGDVVPRGFLSAVNLKQPIEIADGASGRLEFAHWLSSADNPLTARVYANRVWSWLIGQGIVDSVNNFGSTGTEPSHPELLDWLASELVRSGWSTRHLVRLIVHSDVYRRKVNDSYGEAQEVDPDNRLYWRGHARRLSAEELRDSMLWASGELDLAIGGSAADPAAKSDYQYRHRTTRRSLYHPVFRNSLPELYEAFDFAQPSMSAGQRSRSTISTQALALFNEEWVHKRAKALSKRLHNECGTNDRTAWIQTAYAHCFQREPTQEELEICLDYFDPQDSSQHLLRLEQLVHSLLASIDFRFQ